jgi:energy-coupling factor transporter ATP-binding protein EcfA2
MKMQLKNIHYCYPKQIEPIFSGLSLDIKPGEIILLEGANGAGKTSLLRILAGIIPKFIGGNFQGEVQMDEARFGMVFQGSDQQFIHSRVDQEILFILENQEISEEEIHIRFNDLVNTFRLKPFLESEISKLSTGQRQLLKIALAFILNPNVILMDEPLSHLDEVNKKQVLRILHDLKEKKNFTFVIADHEPEAWSALGIYRTIHLSKEIVEHRHQIPELKVNSSDEIILIEILNLTFSYNENKLIYNFKKSVKKGEKIVLSGPNGSGKTTLLSLLMDELTPNEGSIVKQKNLRCKFLTSSSIDHFFSMKMKDEFELENKNIHNANPFPMEKFKDRYVFDLSQGERKKAALDLISDNADVILLDEPFAHLDLQSRETLVEAIDVWVALGKSVIFTAQDSHLYEKWVNQIWNVRLP